MNNDTYKEHAINSFATLSRNIRTAIRTLLKAPSISLIAIMTLALAIGATTAIFSIVNGVLLRPLPFEDPDRLLWITEILPTVEREMVPAPDYLEWRDQNTVFQQIASYGTLNVNLSGVDNPERLEAARVTSEFFSLLQVPPLIGNVFTQQEDRPGADRVVVISQGLWEQRFNMDKTVVGEQIILNDAPYTVIGVMPPQFQFPERVRLWMPLALDEAAERQRNRMTAVSVVGRLKNGVSQRQAQTELEAIESRVVQAHPNSFKGMPTIKLTPLHLHTVGNIRFALWVMLGAAMLILAIACANVTNLILTKAATRHQEMSIRIALGATRFQLIHQLITENLLLGLLGGLLGVVIAHWGIRSLIALVPNELPRLSSAGLDWPVLAFTLGVSVVTAIVFGLAPAFFASSANPNEALKAAGRSNSADKRSHRLRSSIVVTEFALALVLLISAGLMIKSVLRLVSINAGFNPNYVATMTINLPRSKYAKPEQRAAFFTQVLQGVSNTPGVASAGVITSPPLSGSFSVFGPVFIKGDPVDGLREPGVGWTEISPGYFQTMKIPLVRGRDFTDHDNERSQNVAIISESLARSRFHDLDPIGKEVKKGGPTSPYCVIVGLVGDVKHNGLDGEPVDQIYLPFLQSPSAQMTIVARSDSDYAGLATALRNQVWAVDKSQPVYDLMTMNERLSRSTAPRRFNMLLLTIFAVMALFLAVVGIYGVLSRVVAQGTSEIGIRMAFGAQRSSIFRLVLGRGMTLAIVGVGLGVAVSVAATRILSSLVFGVTVVDPSVFAGISLLLIFNAFVACSVPAFRASRMDPLSALRHE